MHSPKRNHWNRIVVLVISSSGRLQNLSRYKKGFVSRQILHLLSRLLNWICSKTGQFKTYIMSNIKPPAAKPALRLCYTCRTKTGFALTLNLSLQSRLCAYSKLAYTKSPLRLCLTCRTKTGFVPSLNLPLQNRLCAYAKPAAPKPALCLRSTCRTKTGFASALNLPFHFE